MFRFRRARERLKQTRGLGAKITLVFHWSKKQLGRLLYDGVLREESRMRSIYDELLWNRVFAQKFIDENVSGLTTDGLVLDAGCGIGRMPTAFSTLGKPIVGVDIVQHDFWHKAGQAASFVVADAEAMPFRDSAFSLCLCLCVLEETEDDELTLQEIRRVLRPRGDFLIRVPNKGNLRTRLTGKMLYAKHLREYDKGKITRLLEGAGFTIKSIRLAGFYSPILTHLVNTLISPQAWLSLGELLPEKYRGVITFICEKAT